MNNTFKIFLAFFCLVTLGLSSCSFNDSFPIGKLYWVKGEWKGRVKGGMMYENWEFGADSAMIGNSCILVHGDTVFKESMQIVQNEEGVFYVVKVDHNDAPVSFKLVDHTSKGALFENPEHDFPNRIVYANTLGDMMLVRIEGVRNDVPDTARFFMHRNIVFPPEESEVW